MANYRKLNFIDIWSHKKDFFWGKYYYAKFEFGLLKDSLLYSPYQGSKAILEIEKHENKDKKLLNKFLDKYSKKSKIRYFVRELDEKSQIDDIEISTSMGFRRYSRNYCFEYRNDSELENKNIKLLCRAADYQDIDEILSLDQNAQVLEYREHLFKKKDYLKDYLPWIYVFSPAIDSSQILAFAIRKEKFGEHCYEFICHPNQSSTLESSIESFAENYLLFEKNSYFQFVIAEAHKELLNKLESNFKLDWSSQLLIYDACPREKTSLLAANKLQALSDAGISASS